MSQVCNNFSRPTPSIYILKYQDYNLTVERLYQTHSHNIHSKISGLVMEVFRKEKLSSSRIHCSHIILSTEFKLSCLLCNHQFQA